MATTQKTRTIMRGKASAALLALFLGLLGLHLFYLGKRGMGWTYLLCTVSGIGIPISLIGSIVDVFNLLGRDPVKFDKEYNQAYRRYERDGETESHASEEERKDEDRLQRIIEASERNRRPDQGE